MENIGQAGQSIGRAQLIPEQELLLISVGSGRILLKVAFVVKITQIVPSVLMRKLDEASFLSYGSYEQQLNHLSICSFYS